MARPRKVTPEAVNDMIDTLIREYEQTENIDLLSDYTLMQRLNISDRTLDRYYSGDADDALLDDDSISTEDKRRYTDKGYGTAIKRLVGYRRQLCTRNIAAGGQVTGWIFLSKQPRWGGFADIQRTETKGEQRISVCISGPDGKPLKE